METFQRPILQKVKSRILEPSKYIQVIVGPRQVGKTTLVHQIIKEIKCPSIFISADAVTISNQFWLEQQWDIARLNQKQSLDSEFLFVIDEVQKIENWSEIVKKLWDEDKTKNNLMKVILLGSSRLLLQKGLTESLAGRYEITYMGHWSFSEMKDAFNFTLEQFMFFGSYPGASSLIGDEDRWKNYIVNSLIEPSISKDIFQLTRIDKPVLLKKLFELGCNYSGQILSFTKILGQLLDAGNTVTLAHYLNLLDTAGLLGGLEKFTSDIIRQRSSSPKFQVHNNALMNAQTNFSFKSALENHGIWGRIVESTVGAHLINYSNSENFNLFYWRYRNDEVDFIIEKNNQIIAIEVKSGQLRSPKGLESFRKHFKTHKTFTIGSTGMPIKTFLEINPKELF